MDLNHQLKLDWAQTGLQTFGGETSLTTKLVLKPNDYIFNKSDSSTTAHNKEANSAESINSRYLIDPIKKDDSQSSLSNSAAASMLQLQDDQNKNYSHKSLSMSISECPENIAATCNIQTTTVNNTHNLIDAIQNRVESGQIVVD